VGALSNVTDYVKKSEKRKPKPKPKPEAGPKPEAEPAVAKVAFLHPEPSESSSSDENAQDAIEGESLRLRGPKWKRDAIPPMSNKKGSRNVSPGSARGPTAQEAAKRSMDLFKTMSYAGIAQNLVREAADKAAKVEKRKKRKRQKLERERSQSPKPKIPGISKCEYLCSWELYNRLSLKHRKKGAECLMLAGPRAELQFALERWRLRLGGKGKARLSRMAKALTRPMRFESEGYPNFEDFLTAMFPLCSKQQINRACEMGLDREKEMLEEERRLEEQRNQEPDSVPTLSVAELVEEALIDQTWVEKLMKELNYSWETGIDRIEFLEQMCPQPLVTIGGMAYDRALHRRRGGDVEEDHVSEKLFLPPIQKDEVMDEAQIQDKENHIVNELKQRKENIRWLKNHNQVTQTSLEEEEAQKSQLELQWAICQLERHRAKENARQLAEGIAARGRSPTKTDRKARAKNVSDFFRDVEGPARVEERRLFGSSMSSLPSNISRKRKKMTSSSEFCGEDEQRKIQNKILTEKLIQNDSYIRSFLHRAHSEKILLKSIVDIRSPERLFQDSKVFSTCGWASRAAHDEQFAHNMDMFKKTFPGSSPQSAKSTQKLKKLQTILKASSTCEKFGINNNEINGLLQTKGSNPSSAPGGSARVSLNPSRKSSKRLSSKKSDGGSIFLTEV